MRDLLLWRLGGLSEFHFLIGGREQSQVVGGVGMLYQKHEELSWDGNI